MSESTKGIIIVASCIMLAWFLGLLTGLTVESDQDVICEYLGGYTADNICIIDGRVVDIEHTVPIIKES